MSDEITPAADAVDAPEPAEVAKKTKAVKAGNKKGKKGGFNIVLVLIPIAVIAAAVLAFSLPPTHAVIVNSPLKPLLARLGLLTPPGKLAAKSKKPGDAGADATAASAAPVDPKVVAAKDAQIAQLQSQVSELQAPPKPSPAAPAVSPTPVVISDAVKRAGTYWAGMDADKAAAIVKQLPDNYVKLVFTQMPPDAVSDIMSELPAQTAARLTSDESGAPSPGPTAGAPAPGATASAPAPGPAVSAPPHGASSSLKSGAPRK